MQTVGQFLKNTRLEKGLSLEQIEKSTKINKRFLKALEDGDYQKLPPPTFIKGFIKNYGDYIGLPVDRLLALFRREYSLSFSPTLLPKAVGGTLFPSFLDLIQNKFFLLGFSLLMVFFLIFLGRKFFIPPRLVLELPADSLVTSDLSIDISGQTEPEARLTINDQAVTLREDGSFMVRVQLAVGVNQITVVAMNKLGRSRKVTKTITVSP